MKNILVKNSMRLFIFALGALFNNALVATFDSGNAQAIGLQSNGTIIAAGNAQIDNNGQVGIARYTAFGELDLTYGNNGFVTSILGTQQASANNLLIDVNNNSIIVGSGIINGVSNLLIARFDTTGNLDATFGTGGTTFSAREVLMRTNPRHLRGPVRLWSAASLLMFSTSFIGKTPRLGRVHQKF